MEKHALWEEPYNNLIIEYPEIVEKTELSKNQAAFVSGMLKEYKPKKILEVGTSAGGSTCLLIETLRELKLKSTVITVDLSEHYYKDEKLETGYLAIDFKNKINSFDEVELIKYSGCLVAEAIDEIGDGIDFLFLDAAHHAPGEIIDFLACYPYLSNGAIVVLHDISLMHKYHDFIFGMSANALLFCSISGRRFIFDDKDGYANEYPNIGAFQISEVTNECIENVFLSLMAKWSYMPDDKQLLTINGLFKRYYSDELCKLFDSSIELNKHSMKMKEDYEGTFRKKIRNLFMRVVRK